MLWYNQDDEYGDDDDDAAAAAAGWTVCCLILIVVIAVVAYFVMHKPGQKKTIYLPQQGGATQAPYGQFPQQGVQQPGQYPVGQRPVQPAVYGQPARPGQPVPLQQQYGKQQQQMQRQTTQQPPAHAPHEIPAVETKEEQTDAEKKKEEKKEEARQQVIKQEIHYHYASQYDQSKKTKTVTENIKDSVYYKKDPQKMDDEDEDNSGDAFPAPPDPLDEAGAEEATCPQCGVAVRDTWKICPMCTAKLS